MTGLRPLRLALLPAVATALPWMAPAWGDGLPRLHPMRDVAVIYKVKANPAGGREEKQTLRMFWGEGGHLLRAEIGGQNAVALVDFLARRVQVLVSSQHLVLEAPFDERLIPGFAFPAGVTAQRTGTDRIAGTECTQFRLKSPSGDGQVCVTGDGVVLSAGGSAQQGSATLQAIAVTYGPQPASLFSVPAGYRRMDLVPARR